MSPLFIVGFKDGSIFEGGVDYTETKWLQIPHKEIAAISYRLPDGNYLVVSGAEEYFHMVEVVQDIYGGQPGVPKLEYAYLMTKKNGIVTSYRMTLMNMDTFRMGDITRREFSVDDPKIKGLNPNSWVGK